MKPSKKHKLESLDRGVLFSCHTCGDRFRIRGQWIYYPDKDLYAKAPAGYIKYLFEVCSTCPDADNCPGKCEIEHDSRDIPAASQ
jgi:hypothetical protein